MHFIIGCADAIRYLIGGVTNSISTQKATFYGGGGATQLLPKDGGERPNSRAHFMIGLLLVSQCVAFSK